MKILMMILMVVLSGCESTPMKQGVFLSSEKFPRGEYLFVSKGYDLNGVRLCLYTDNGRDINIPSRALDKWGAGRCPSKVSLI